MFVTTHALLGALVAEQVPHEPWLAFVLGMATHFLSDIIPHGDTAMYKGYISGSKVKRAIAYAAIDSCVAIATVLFLFNTKFFENRFSISMGIIGGILPDFLVAVYEVFRFKWLRWFHRLHFYFHNLICSHHGDMAFSSGFAMQMIFLAALISRVL